MRPVIDRHFPLEALVAAFQHQAMGGTSGRLRWILSRPGEARRSWTFSSTHGLTVRSFDDA